MNSPMIRTTSSSIVSDTVAVVAVVADEDFNGDESCRTGNRSSLGGIDTGTHNSCCNIVEVVMEDTEHRRRNNRMNDSDPAAIADAIPIGMVKPKHPYTAYTRYFQYEQDRIRCGVEHVPITIEDIVIRLRIEGNEDGASSSLVSSSSTCVGSCHRQRPCHPRNQLSFVELVRHISSKWKGLEPHLRQIFLDLADEDRIRYVNEMKEWNDYHKQKEAE